jgi:hypothetical protein
MATDYIALANVARGLVEETGREMTFIQYSQTPADPAAPWAGPADPRASVAQQHTLAAVGVDVGTSKELGMAAVPEDLLKRVSQFLIVAPGAGFAGDLRDIHEVVDQSTRWGVKVVRELRPAAVTLLYFVGVGR